MSSYPSTVDTQVHGRNPFWENRIISFNYETSLCDVLTDDARIRRQLKRAVQTIRARCTADRISFIYTLQNFTYKSFSLAISSQNFQ